MLVFQEQTVIDSFFSVKMVETKRKAKPLTLSAKAYFDGWSSQVAWAKVLYKPNTDKIVFLKTWGQKKKSEAEGEYRKPRFPKKSYLQLLNYARRMYEAGYKRSVGVSSEVKRTAKGHEQKYCERCKELRRPCNK